MADSKMESPNAVVLEEFAHEVITGHCESTLPDTAVWNTCCPGRAGTGSAGTIGRRSFRISLKFGEQSPVGLRILLRDPGVLRTGAIQVLPKRDRGPIRKFRVHDRIRHNISGDVLDT